MSPSNMISVTVATCFVVFIGPGNSSLLYYAAKASDSVQARPRNGRYNVHVARTRFGTATIGIYAALRPSAGSQRQFGWAQNQASAGFSLIELLIVVAIILIIAAIAIPKLLRVR